MAPSASKSKRLAEKAAKAAEKGSKSSGTTPGTSTTGAGTPMTSVSANGSQEDLADAHAQMARLNLATDRSAVSFSF